MRLTSIVVLTLLSLAVSAGAGSYSLGIVAEPGTVLGDEREVLALHLTSPWINDAGLILFQAGTRGRDGLYTQAGAVVESDVVIGGKRLHSFGGHPTMNDAGVAVFHSAYWEGGTASKLGLFVSDGSVAVVPGGTICGLTIRDLDLKSRVGIDNAGNVFEIRSSLRSAPSTSRRKVSVRSRSSVSS